MTELICVYCFPASSAPAGKAAENRVQAKRKAFKVLFFMFFSILPLYWTA
jgi:hypothetical protein